MILSAFAFVVHDAISQHNLMTLMGRRLQRKQPVSSRMSAAKCITCHVADILAPQQTRHRGMRYIVELGERCVKSVGFAKMRACGHRVSRRPRWRRLALQAASTQRLEPGSCNVPAPVLWGIHRSDKAETFRSINVQWPSCSISSCSMSSFSTSVALLELCGLWVALSI